MTTPAPTLTAIVESVARDHHERWAERQLAVIPDASIPSWDDRDDMSKHAIREAVLPAVRATLTALMPLADGWEEWARKNEREADELAEAADAAKDRSDSDYKWTASQRAYTARDVHNSCAKALRGVLS
ncbi:hypothetical protein [Demequina sp. SO4-18]|uniref:hypothetical protein n=1 Tax=Demequina sp. SO4-18 TaxID=3401026 RepID=UPI003B58CD4B